MVYRTQIYKEIRANMVLSFACPMRNYLAQKREEGVVGSRGLTLRKVGASLKEPVFICQLSVDALRFSTPPHLHIDINISSD